MKISDTHFCFTANASKRQEKYSCKIACAVLETQMSRAQQTSGVIMRVPPIRYTVEN